MSHRLFIRVICGESPPVDTGNLWWVTQSEWTAPNESWPSPTCWPVNPVYQFRWKELFTRSTLVDSTVFISLGETCKRAFSPTEKETSTEACQGRARFQQHRDASCHQGSFPTRQGGRRKFTPFWQKRYLVSFLVRLRTYQHPCMPCILKGCRALDTVYSTALHNASKLPRCLTLWRLTTHIVVVPQR